MTTDELREHCARHIARYKAPVGPATAPSPGIEGAV
jgi:hypothetical protein